MNPPRLVVVVLNWNNAPDTLRCLDALAASDYEGFEVVVVDNASTDGSVAILRERQPNLALLENGENLGYAGGNNVGIQYALDRGAGYVLLLNDDSVVAPDALSALMAAAEDHPDVGFLGPKVLSLEEPSRLLSAGGILDRECRSSHRGGGEPDEGQFDELAEVDWLSGCALLVSREAVRRVGMLDPAFFAYHEDVEWCYRGRQAGLHVLFVPGARVWHPDTRVQQLDSPLVTYYMARNSLLFLVKHRLGISLLLRRLGRYLYWLASWSIRPRWRHKRRQRDALLQAVLDFGRRRFGRADLRVQE
jgi:GT2 family glycosyltransferase